MFPSKSSGQRADAPVLTEKTGSRAVPQENLSTINSQDWREIGFSAGVGMSAAVAQPVETPLNPAHAQQQAGTSNLEEAAGNDDQEEQRRRKPRSSGDDFVQNPTRRTQRARVRGIGLISAVSYLYVKYY